MRLIKKLNILLIISVLAVMSGCGQKKEASKSHLEKSGNIEEYQTNESTETDDEVALDIGNLPQESSSVKTNNSSSEPVKKDGDDIIIWERAKDSNGEYMYLPEQQKAFNGETQAVEPTKFYEGLTAPEGFEIQELKDTLSNKNVFTVVPAGSIQEESGDSTSFSYETTETTADGENGILAFNFESYISESDIETEINAFKESELAQEGVSITSEDGNDNYKLIVYSYNKNSKNFIYAKQLDNSEVQVIIVSYINDTTQDSPYSAMFDSLMSVLDKS